MVANPQDESAAQQKAIIVVGVHRSGTLAMSCLVHILSVDLGPNLTQQWCMGYNKNYNTTEYTSATITVFGPVS
jgi:hypothetical protein